ncbi:acyl carrier protein [Halovulum sp. GXIMD14793]
MTDIEQAVARHIRAVTNGRITLPDAEIIASDIDTLKLDSLESLEMVMKLEDEFGLELDEESVADCVSIADVIGLVATAKEAA